MTILRILVCGGRTYANRERVFQTLDGYLPLTNATQLEIVHGGASGADSLAHEWAVSHNVAAHVFKANWRDGKSAGPRRNQAMLDQARPDMVIAFPGGTGTSDMVRRANAAGINVVITGFLALNGK